MCAQIDSSDRFVALPDEETLAATAAALEERGFGGEIVDDLAGAREAVLARIPRGSSVMTNPSVTLEETGIAAAIDGGGDYDSARARLATLDRATQLPQMKAVFIQPDFALGSVHAVTRDGTLVVASALGSQLAAYAWGAANVILVVGAQKLVPDLDAAHERIAPALSRAQERAYARGLRAEEPHRQDPRDPPGGSRPHPRRPHPRGGGVLTRRGHRDGSDGTSPLVRYPIEIRE